MFVAASNGSKDAVDELMNALDHNEAEERQLAALGYLMILNGIMPNISPPFKNEIVKMKVIQKYLNYDRNLPSFHPSKPFISFILGIYAFIFTIDSIPQKKGIEWLKLVADKGFSLAQLLYGLALLRGFGDLKDEVEAVRLFRLAADQGNMKAHYNLGVCYFHGDGVPKDEVEAVRLFLLAADQGNMEAQSNLGVCYLHGKGVPKDEVEAARLFRESF